MKNIATGNSFGHIILACLFLVFQTGCGPAIITDPAAFMHYLADPANGLVRQKTVGGFNIRVKYLPPAYLAYQEFYGGLNQSPLDSLVERYRSSETFLLTITPEDIGKLEIARLHVSNYQEFNQRVLNLNFHIKEQLWLENGKHRISAAQTEFERNYGLDQSGNILIVFAFEKDDSSDWVVIWNDEFFQTGLHRFLFKQTDIQKIPRLQLTHHKNRQ